MKQYKTKKEDVHYISSVTCDKCGQEIKPKFDTILEYVNITHRFGYSAEVFDDEECHNVDICEKCWADIIKDFKNKPHNFNKNIWR